MYLGASVIASTGIVVCSLFAATKQAFNYDPSKVDLARYLLLCTEKVTAFIHCSSVVVTRIHAVALTGVPIAVQQSPTKITFICSAHSIELSHCARRIEKEQILNKHILSFVIELACGL